MGEHRVPALSGGLRRFPDPERSPDPRIRAVLSELRTLDFAPAPRAHFRAELRAQLVAVTPRLVAEGTAIEQRPVRTAVVEPRRAPVAVRLRPGRVVALSLARPLAMVAAVAAIFAMLLGSAVWMSKSALPGDTLYGLKRANEDVQLSLTSGDVSRGRTLLSFATNRANEVSDLLSRASALAAGPGATAAAGINAHTAKLIVDTLNSADDDVRSAAQVLGNESVQSKSAAPLNAMTSWAPSQAKLLQAIVDRMPAGDVRDHAVTSQQLVTAANTRALALQSLAGCSCLGSTTTDELGPVPCTVCSVPALPTAPAHNNAPATSTHPAVTPGNTPDTSVSAPGVTLPSGLPTDLPSGLPTDLPSGLPTQLPSLPLTNLPSLPLTLLPTGTSSTCVVNLLGICVKL